MRYMNPYLIFNGNCRQAMTFYKKCLGGVLSMQPYSAAPGTDNLPKEAKNWIIHARLTIKSIVLMASDTRPGMPVRIGDNTFISINCDSVAEVKKLFKALVVKGKADLLPQKTFFSPSFAMLTDQFGIKWMLNMEAAK